MANENATIAALTKRLKEGETVSKSQRVILEDIQGKAVKKTLNTMRNSMNQLAARAREETEREYKVESGQFLTYDGTAIMLVVTITCVADEGEDDI